MRPGAVHRCARARAPEQPCVSDLNERLWDNMDSKRKRFDWLPVEMPGVARLVAEKRRLYGDQHVNECWKRGVLQLEPGWFFAREGALAVGAPFADPTLANFAAAQVTSSQAVLVIREPGAAHGAH